MKILITTDAFPPGGGGSAQSTAALARALARRSHEVHVVVAKRGVAGELRRDWEGVSVVEVGVGSSRLGRAERQRRMKSFLSGWAPEQRFDVAHAQHWLSAGATTDASRKLGLPVVVTVRDYWPVCIWSTRLSGKNRCPGCTYLRRVVCLGRRRPWLWPLATLAPFWIGRELDGRLDTLRRADAVVAVSQCVRRTLPLEHVTVVPNLLDLLDIERRLAGRSLPELPEDFVLFVGKLELNKAPDRLLPILRAANVRVPLVIAGQGALERRLRKAARRAEEEVRFLGWVDADDTLALMQRASAVLFPSRWDEPLSRVLLEGLAVGAALVVEPTGGSDEIVVHGESGLTGRSVQELGAALRRVLREEGLATRFRQGARRRARERFSLDVVLPELETLYRRVAP